MVLTPAKEKEAEAIFRKWGLDFAVIGKTTDTLRFVIKHGGEVKADRRSRSSAMRRRSMTVRTSRLRKNCRSTPPPRQRRCRTPTRF